MRLRAKPPAASNLFTEAPFPTPMRIAAVGDVHGGENLPGLQKDLETLPRTDLFLLAGGLTDHKDPDALVEGVEAVPAPRSSPIFGGVGDNQENGSPDEHRRKSGGPLHRDGAP